MILMCEKWNGIGYHYVDIILKTNVFIVFTELMCYQLFHTTEQGVYRP